MLEKKAEKRANIKEVIGNYWFDTL